MTEPLTHQDWLRIAKGGFDAQDPVEYAAAYGLFKGGEELLQEQLGNSVLNADLRTVIDLGLHQLVARRIHLLTAQEVVTRLEAALAAGSGFAVIRFGDGELLTLAQDSVLTTDEVRLAAPWLHLSGVIVPDLQARDKLADAFQSADVVGVPTSRFMTYGTLFLRLASFYHWPIETMPLTSSVINYAINETTDFYQHVLQTRKVLLIGNRSAQLQTVLEARGVTSIVGHVPVTGMSAIPTALNESFQYDFDVALVAAGIPACVICPELRDRGKVAIDFGHLADVWVDGQ